jgi:hypothetical protein
VFWSIVVKEKPTVGSPFFGAFPPDHISKATKDDNVHFFIHSFTIRDELKMDKALAINKSCNLFQQCPGNFETSTFCCDLCYGTV